jgi:hypothetical protein
MVIMSKQESIPIKKDNDNAIKEVSIIGAGPVGAMDALLLATLNPGVTINLIDKRDSHSRNYALNIWSSTVKYIKSQLDEAEKISKKELENNDISDDDKNRHNKILTNIKSTKNFLDKEINKSFISTTHNISKLSNMLEEQAKKIGKVNIIKPKHDEKSGGVTEDHLSNLKKDTKAAKDENDEVGKALDNSQVIIGAEGFHSNVKKIIFEDKKKPEKVKYLVEFKYIPKEKKEGTLSKIGKELVGLSELIFNPALGASRLYDDTFEPTIKNAQINVSTVGKENATLHIIIDKNSYELLRDPNTSDQWDQLGSQVKPYTNMEQIPLHLRDKFKRIVEDQIGMENLEGIKISAIPMQVGHAENMTKKIYNKQFILNGDALTQLIFIRGVNEGLQTAGDTALNVFKQVNNIKVDEKELQNKVFKRVDGKIKSIKWEIWGSELFEGSMSRIHGAGTWTKAIALPVLAVLVNVTGLLASTVPAFNEFIRKIPVIGELIAGFMENILKNSEVLTPIFAITTATTAIIGVPVTLATKKVIDVNNEKTSKTITSNWSDNVNIEKEKKKEVQL